MRQAAALLGALAERQAGAFSAHQASLAGYSPSAIRTNVSTGRWVRCTAACSPSPARPTRPSDDIGERGLRWGRSRSGLIVTTPTRSLFDAAGVLTAAELEHAYDSGASKRLYTPAHLLAELRRTARPGRPGSKALRGVLLAQGVGSGRSPSYLEAKALKHDLSRRNRIVLGDLRVLIYAYDDIVRRGRATVAEVLDALALRAQ